MSYIIAQNLIYLILAFLLGAFIAWIFGLCRCNKDDIIAELEGAKAERNELAERLAKISSDNSEVISEKDAAKIASLEDEIAAANAKIEKLESDISINVKSGNVKSGALGLATGGVIGAALNSGETTINTEELEILKTRNKFLETRVKFFEDDAKAAENKTAAKFANTYSDTQVTSNKNFAISPAGNMTADELEELIIAEGDGIKPKEVARGTDADDLLLIDGVGPKNNEWLIANGIHYFWQIATMSTSELAWIAKNLPNFGTRVYRENWVAQCANLAKGLPPR